MIIKRVEKLIVFPRKIWKSELLKVINSKTLKIIEKNIFYSFMRNNLTKNEF